MRVFAALIVVVQLLAQAASVSHSHAHLGSSEAGGHQNRPHLHIGSHSHAHHVHSQSCGHDFRSCPDPRRHCDGRNSTTLAQVASLPISSEHDDDALYVSIDTPILNSERIHVSDRNNVVDGFVFVPPVSESSVQCGLNEFLATGSMADRILAPIAFLPHVLRV